MLHHGLDLCDARPNYFQPALKKMNPPMLEVSRPTPCLIRGLSLVQLGTGKGDLPY